MYESAFRSIDGTLWKDAGCSFAKYVFAIIGSLAMKINEKI
jgi:hypothetical protein